MISLYNKVNIWWVETLLVYFDAITSILWTIWDLCFTIDFVVVQFESYQAMIK